MWGAFVVVAQACYLEMECKVLSFGSCRAFFLLLFVFVFKYGQVCFLYRQEQPWEILESYIDLSLEAARKRPAGPPRVAA